MREDFSLFRLPDSVLALFPPDRNGLFDLVRSEIPESSLRVISRCDYDTESDANFAALSRLRDRIGLDKPIGWIPGEVLSLYRWSGPKDQQDFRDLNDFHLTRAFACAAFTVTQDEHENHLPFAADVLGPLLESSLALGEPFLTEFSNLTSYAVSNLKPWDEEFLFAAFALYASYVLSRDPDDSVANQLGIWLAAVHADALNWHDSVMPLETRTFLDIEFATIQPQIWRRIAADIVDKVPDPPDFLRSVGQPEPITHRVSRAKRNMKLTWYGLSLTPGILGQAARLIRRVKQG